MNNWKVTTEKGINAMRLFEKRLSKRESDFLVYLMDNESTKEDVTAIPIKKIKDDLGIKGDITPTIFSFLKLMAVKKGVKLGIKIKYPVFENIVIEQETGVLLYRINHIAKKVLQNQR